MSQERTDNGAASASPRVEAALAVGSDILDEVQSTLSGGRIRRVRIKLGRRTIREIPVQAAALTAILIAAAAVIVSQLSIEIDKD
ncbi:MAG TPA: DUF4342 domain-containing protein [Armatimonadota bacterium]|jgi:hypothetical protein